MSHKFTYTHPLSSVSTTIEVMEDANIATMIQAFEIYLKSCEYSFDGRHIELVGDDV